MLPTIATGNVASATATTGYEVANSLRFEDAYLQNPSSGASSTAERRTLTWSFWFKRSKLGAVSSTQYVITGRESSGNYYIAILLNSTDQLRVIQSAGGSTEMDLKTNRKFRDTASWYHVVVAIDTTQSTSSNRVKIYINGVQEDSFATETYPSQNLNTYFGMTSGTDGYPTYVGSDTSNHFYGYMAEVVEVGGSQLNADSFGEFDSDTNIWIPKDLSDLSFGSTAGANVYLDFEDSSTLGNDVSGGNNDYSVNNLTSIDQTTDTCTNNFATLNPLQNSAPTYSEGNLQFKNTHASNSEQGQFTIAQAFSGKWYYEIKVASSTNNSQYEYFGHPTGYVRTNGTIHPSGSTTVSNGDIFGFLANYDDGQITIYRNGTQIYQSSSGITLDDTVGVVGNFNNTIFQTNFGNPIFSISSGNSDPAGYGNFEYSTNGGYALNTKNLAEYG